MKIYVVSGFYYFNNNTFELDEMPQSVHTSLEEANKVCENTFEKYLYNHLEEVEKVINEDGTLSCLAYDEEYGDRVVLGVKAYEV